MPHTSLAVFLHIFLHFYHEIKAFLAVNTWGIWIYMWPIFLNYSTTTRINTPIVPIIRRCKETDLFVGCEVMFYYL